jgi:CubicO group peptidase (beta-lactamase class C family)
MLNRHPAAGLALGVVRNGPHEPFYGHGLRDIPSKTPISEDLVFRIGALTRLFAAIAVMQLWEQWLADLDAPANDCLHTQRLVPAQAGFRPATVRHILTHTAGIPESVYAAGLLHPSWRPFDSRPAVHSVQVGEPLPSRAEDYRDGPRMVVEPVSAFAYTDSGFATLGQIVEDVSGTPFERSLRERILDPLGMADSDHA